MEQLPAVRSFQFRAATTGRTFIVLAAIASCQQQRDRARPDPAPAGVPEDTYGVSLPDEPDATPPPPAARPVPALPVPLPGVRRDVTSFVGTATRAAIGDLDGDGKNEIVVCDAAQLRVIDPSGTVRASTSVTRGILVLVVADLDGDGHAEILTGWGQTREHLDATARVAIYRLVGDRLLEEPVAAPPTLRNEVVSIVPFPPREQAFLFAYYDSKYVVRSVIARRTSTWKTTDLTSLRTAEAYGRGDLDGDGVPDVVVGRVYGDDKASDGDAFVLRPNGTRVAIPTTRGVRQLAIADTDGDGRAELFLSDGWHQNYGGLARGLVTWVRWIGGTYKSELIEDTAGQYSAGRLLAADVDADGRPELISLGSHYVRVFHRDGDHWRGLTIAPAARDIAIGDLDGVAGAEILVVGDKSEIITLHPADWK